MTIAVQVNGKLRDTLTLPKGIAREDGRGGGAGVATRSCASLDGKPPKKVIVVPDRLVNIVA